MRINKYIAACGVCSRRKAEDFVLDRMVKINGEVVTNLATEVDEKKDRVTLNDIEIVPTKDFIYLMLNKPKGYVTTMSDDRDRRSIAHLLGDLDKRVFPVGRLDYDSEGLLILTNDGDLAFKLSHPKFAVAKTYVVKVEGEVKESEMAVLRAGVVVDGERYGKSKVKLLNFEEGISRLEVTIFEGKNREIRKMFAAIHREVIFLKRLAVGSLKLGGLKRGEMRALKIQEVEQLRNIVAENENQTD